jgi:hypothetical protein
MQVDLLAAPDGGRREVLVDPGLDVDAVLVEIAPGAGELLVVAAERRAAIAGDEACGVQAGPPVAQKI